MGNNFNLIYSFVPCNTDPLTFFENLLKSLHSYISGVGTRLGDSGYFIRRNRTPSFSRITLFVYFDIAATGK